MTYMSGSSQMASYRGNCNSGNCSQPSSLETMVRGYQPASSGQIIAYRVAETIQLQEYATVLNLVDMADINRPSEFISPSIDKERDYDSSGADYSAQIPGSSEYMLSPDYQSEARQTFLRPDRKMTPVIGNADDIMHYIQDTFEKTTGDSLPKDFTIRICSADEMSKRHGEFGGKWHPGILGFAINNREKKSQKSLIFIKENNLDELMLTIGHEIGHVLTAQLPDPRDEEAKAFAFEIAWLESIREHNIAGLADQFVSAIAPAKNGLHNVAFEFVTSLLAEGRSSMDLFDDLRRKNISVRHSSMLDL